MRGDDIAERIRVVRFERRILAALRVVAFSVSVLAAVEVLRVIVTLWRMGVI